MERHARRQVANDHGKNLVSLVLIFVNGTYFAIFTLYFCALFNEFAMKFSESLRKVRFHGYLFSLRLKNEIGTFKVVQNKMFPAVSNSS